MPKKDVLPPVRIEHNHSLAADFTTVPTIVTFTDNIAYQINITTTNSTGTFAVQGSLDYQKPGPLANSGNTGHWADLMLSGTPTAGAANDTILINLNQIPYNAIRLSYDSTVAGTGTCDIFVETKAV